jgi:hypothetical protein
MSRRSYLQRLVGPAQPGAQLFVVPQIRSGLDAVAPSYPELAARLRKFTAPAAIVAATAAVAARVNPAASTRERDSPGLPLQGAEHTHEAQTAKRVTAQPPQPSLGPTEPANRPAIRESREPAAESPALPPEPLLRAPSRSSDPTAGAGSADPRTVREADPGRQQPVEVHIGTVEVRTREPPQRAARPAASEAAAKAHSDRTAQPGPMRGYASRFGLAQR